MGIRRADGQYVGAPQGDTTMRGGDVLTCYGREPVLRHLASRPREAEGDAEHAAAVAEHQRLQEEEKELS